MTQYNNLEKIFWKILCVFFSSILLCTNTLAVIDEWPMSGHDQIHSGYSTSTAPSTNNTVYIKDLEGYTDGVCAVDGNVYVSTYDFYDGTYNTYSHLYCYKASTGDLVFDRNYTDSFFTTAPAIHNGRVYIGSNRYVYCLSGSNGSVLWSYDAGGLCSSPTFADENIFIACDTRMICLNLNGRPVWNYTTTDMVYSVPSVVDGKVFFGSDDGTIYCVNEHNGSLLWHEYLHNTYVRSSPSVDNGRVFFTVIKFVPFETPGGSTIIGGAVYGVQAVNGHRLWNFTTAFDYPTSTALFNNRVFLGSVGYFYCLNADTGQEIWNQSIENYYDDMLPSPVIADGKIYFTSGLAIYCLNVNTGATLWMYPTVSPASFALNNGILFAACGTQLLAFGPSPNQAPLTPTTPNGFHQGISNMEYTYSTSTTDPNGDLIRYQWQFGDDYTDWSGYYPSGATIQQPYTWLAAGTYEVRARAKDSSNAESSWSSPLIVTISAPSQQVGFLYGIVTDNSGIPLPNVTISIDVPDEIKEVMSDNEGRYNILLPIGTYTVHAWKNGYQTSTSTDIVIQTTPPTELDIILKPNETAPPPSGDYNYVDYTLAQLTDQNKIGARIDVSAGETPEVVAYNQDLSIQVESPLKEKIQFTVSATEGTSATIIVVRAGEGVFSTTENLQILFDEQSLTEVTNAIEFFDLTNNQPSSYMEASTKTGDFFFIRINSFSTHSITISALMKTINFLLDISLYILFSVVILLVFFTPMLTNMVRRRRLLRK